MKSIEMPSAAEVTVMLCGALAQIDFARRYTEELLSNTPNELWFDSPATAPTSVAWQVGHLAVSQYGLLMYRIHGRRDADLDLIPGKFRKTFGRGSDPQGPQVASYSVGELVAKLDEVHELAIGGLQSVGADVLLETVDMPYAAYPIKLGAILFCPLHEQIHAGQIGLLRRLLNLPSVR